ncbi:nucleotide-diphospho-sugar transferase [Catenaria anguillulae PL171]|uniref:Nucleotide-diphospho-sugar transferase n=1 Tax=Catenaria anguillulae PL171 TaxID=765915 RepID=A0A1Y2HLA2_9FUNG|nr:nucleotide-diphospho-sugar transferase [Catenaria anguillulae PL171]
MSLPRTRMLRIALALVVLVILLASPPRTGPIDWRDSGDLSRPSRAVTGPSGSNPPGAPPPIHSSNNPVPEPPKTIDEPVPVALTHDSDVPARSPNGSPPPPPPPPVPPAPPTSPPTLQSGDAYDKSLAIRDAFIRSRSHASTLWRTGITPLIHMIWVGGPMPDSARQCRDRWASLNPQHTIVQWDDAAGVKLVERHFPEYLALYHALPKPVMRSDWIRLMAVGVFGGVYADIDACPLKPIQDWGLDDSVGLVAGIETDTTRDDWMKWYPRQLQICSWTFAGAPGHPAYWMAVHESAERMRKVWIPERPLPRDAAKANVPADQLGKWPANVRDQICELTGPALVTDSFFRYMSAFGDVSFGKLHEMTERKQFGDAVLLPITGFSPGVGHMGSRPITDPQALVHHLFYGTWQHTKR